MPTQTGVPEGTKELRAAISEAVDRSTGPEVSKAEANTIAAVAAAEVKQDPVATNALNQEPFWQSGVGVFGTGGLVWSLGAVLTQVGEHGSDFAAYDMDTTITALGTLGMFGMVLYRRFMPGLKPMFWWATR